MRLVDAYSIRCERDDFDTFNDYMTALRNIKHAEKVDVIPTQWIKKHYGECERIKQMLKEWEDNETD